MPYELIVTRDEPEVISGAVNTYAYAGMGMQYDPADPANLIPASGVTGFILERNVVDEGMIDHLARHTFPGRQLLPNEVKGAVCSARKALEIEVEGAELLVLSSTGTLSGATAGDPVSYADGKLRSMEGGKEVAGHIRAVLDPVLEGNTKRFLIEIAR